MVLLIDHYDSFSFNLYQLVGAINPDIRVIRSNELTVQEIEALHPTHVILSPGTGRPAEAGVYESLIRQWNGTYPILGVCLGHQAIAEALGGTVTYAQTVMHGKSGDVTVTAPSKLFKGLPDTFPVARYHSLAVKQEDLPEDLIVTAIAEDGEIMAMEHREYPLYGVQFHPESILTPHGEMMMRNFLQNP